MRARMVWAGPRKSTSERWGCACNHDASSRDLPRQAQLSTSFRLTASGNGLCFVPDIMFKTHLYNEDVVFYNIKGAGGRTLYVINSHNNRTTTAVQKFKAVARSVMKQISQREPFKQNKEE